MPPSHELLVLCPATAESILSETDLTDLKIQIPRQNASLSLIAEPRTFIEGNQRYCLWITDSQAQEAQESAWISGRRFQSTRPVTPSTTRVVQAGHIYLYSALTSLPIRCPVPRFFRTTRLYPHQLGPETVISDAANAIYDAEYLVVRVANLADAWPGSGCRRKTRNTYRYSNTLVYNNFPSPLTDQSEEEAPHTTCIPRA